MKKRNPAKQAGYSRKFYENNRAKVVANVRARRAKASAWWREYKRSLVCWHCGEDHPACIDLHHVILAEPGTPTPSKWRSAGWGVERMLRELDKVVPLCANCHRKVHAMHAEMLRENKQKSGSSKVEQ